MPGRPRELRQYVDIPAAGLLPFATFFFPDFWEGTGWGFGVAVTTQGPRRGRIGWSDGLGTNFFVDPDGTVGILLTQVEMSEDMGSLLAQFQSLHEPS